MWESKVFHNRGESSAFYERGESFPRRNTSSDDRISTDTKPVKQLGVRVVCELQPIAPGGVLGCALCKRDLLRKHRDTQKQPQCETQYTLHGLLLGERGIYYCSL